MLHSGIFPEQLKVSKLILLHEANDKLLPTNYRPIALLPSISKILEDILLEQLTNHFIENKSLLSNMALLLNTRLNLLH